MGGTGPKWTRLPIHTERHCGLKLPPDIVLRAIEGGESGGRKQLNRQGDVEAAQVKPEKRPAVLPGSRSKEDGRLEAGARGKRKKRIVLYKLRKRYGLKQGRISFKKRNRVK